MFDDRVHAGTLLAARIASLEPERPVVLALPRGGVPVAVPVAELLGAPLDVVLVRKIGAPHQRELAVAAVVDGSRPELVRNDELIELLGLSDRYLEQEMRVQLEEIERRRELYCSGRARATIEGSTAILVDDGIATGATARAAIRAVRRARPAALWLAVPVAAPETLESLRPEVDRIGCLVTPADLGAVGRFYEDFRQIPDDEVRELLIASASDP